MAKINLTPLSTVIDEVWGEKGTPKRDAMEEQLKEEVNSYSLGRLFARLVWLKTLHRTNLANVLVCNGHRFVVWRVAELT